MGPFLSEGLMNQVSYSMVPFEDYASHNPLKARVNRARRCPPKKTGIPRPWIEGFIGLHVHYSGPVYPWGAFFISIHLSNE